MYFLANSGCIFRSLIGGKYAQNVEAEQKASMGKHKKMIFLRLYASWTVVRRHTFASCFNNQLKHNDMKNLFLPAIFSILFLAAACNKVDPSLVSTMQSDIANAEELVPTLGKTVEMANMTIEQINKAPEALRNSNTPEMQSILERSVALAGKVQATEAQYKDMLNRFKQLSADYAAGKIKTEEAKKEYEMLSTSLKGAAGTLERIDKFSDLLQADFAKASAGWNAEAEKELK